MGMGIFIYKKAMEETEDRIKSESGRQPWLIRYEFFGKHQINPIIDTRMLWKNSDTDPTRAYDKYDGICYNQKKHVHFS